MEAIFFTILVTDSEGMTEVMHWWRPPGTWDWEMGWDGKVHTAQQSGITLS